MTLDISVQNHFSTVYQLILTLTFTVQSKDKLISSLKKGSNIEGGDSGVSFAELEELRHERDMYKEELQQTRIDMQQLRADLQVKRGAVFWYLSSLPRFVVDSTSISTNPDNNLFDS